MYLKRNNQFLKKSAAVATASAMVMSAAVPVMADGTSFTEKGKAELAAFCEELAESWDAELAGTEEKSKADAKVNLTLSLDETGQTMVGMIAGMDASWMKNISFDMLGTLADGKEAVKADVLVNDFKICSMNVIMDMLAGMEYVQVPEMTESWIKADLNVTMNGEDVSGESLQVFSGLTSDPTVLFPEGKEFAELVERYGTIVLNHMQDGPSLEEAVSVEGISEDCTMLEGQIYQEDAVEMVKDLLTTAQSDEQVEALLTKWSEAMPEAGDLNADFQSFIEETLADMETAGTEEEESSAAEYIAARVWENGEGEVVGQELAFCTGIESDFSFTYKAPKSEDSSALLVDIQSEGSGLTFTGSSQEADGVKTGSYSLAVDGITMMEFATESDIAAAEEGYPVATCTITFPQGDSEENYNPLSLFSLVLSLDSQKENNSVNLNLAVLSSGVQLGSLNLSTQESDETVEINADEAMENAYYVMSEEDMTAYAAELNFDTIIENIKNAGVPAELVDAMVQSMMASESGETEAPAAEEPAADTAEEA